jgi:hypothetical protein
MIARMLCLAATLIACATCSKGEKSMTSSTTSPLSAFAALRGGYSEAIAPGPQLVTLGRGGATWWQGDQPIPPHVSVDGSRWAGSVLRVGLGTLDLHARSWREDPALAAWNRPGPDGRVPVREVAWFGDAKHVALQLEAAEIVIVAADGRERGRYKLGVIAPMTASGDRVLVAGDKPVVLDLDAKVVAEPALQPLGTLRVREGSGLFAAVGATGAVTLIRPADGATLATWNIHAIDAVPVPNGIVAIDFQGMVAVGCVDGSSVRKAAEAASGVSAAILQHVDDRIVVAGAGADPVKAATFTNPCH